MRNERGEKLDIKLTESLRRRHDWSNLKYRRLQKGEKRRKRNRQKQP